MVSINNKRAAHRCPIPKLQLHALASEHIHANAQAHRPNLNRSCISRHLSYAVRIKMDR
jgi:hypothetical protein